MAIFSKFYFSHEKFNNTLKNAWNHLKICRNDLWGILNNFLKQIFDILIFHNSMASTAEPEGKKREKMQFFHFQRCEKSRKIKISKIRFRNFLNHSRDGFYRFLGDLKYFLNIRDFRQQQKPCLTFLFITFEPSISSSSMSTFWKLERQLYNI